MKEKIFLTVLVIGGCLTLQQALGQIPVSCSDALRQGLSVGNGEYWVDPDGAGGNAPFLVYCDMAGGGWQLIYNRNNAYFTPDHMVQRYPTEPMNFNANSIGWSIPPDANVWKWEISVDGGQSVRAITTAIPAEALAETHSTVIDVPVFQVRDNTLGSEGPFFYQSFILDDQCLYGCNSGRATWWGLVNVLQGAGDQLNPGIGGHSDWCDFDNNLLSGDNYTWGDDDLELYLSDYKDVQGDGIGGTNCIPNAPTDHYRYRFWARDERTCPRDASLDLEKYVNDQDADVAPGAPIPVGGPVEFLFVVKNNGLVPLFGLMVADNTLGIVCKKGQIDSGETMICTVEREATEGPHKNRAKAGAACIDEAGKKFSVGDVDLGHYTGIVPPGIEHVKNF